MEIYYEDEEGLDFIYEPDKEELKKVIEEVLENKTKKELIELLMEIDFVPRGKKMSVLEEECEEEIREHFEEKAQKQNQEWKDEEW